MAGQGFEVRRFLPALRKLRKARVARDAGHIAWMYQAYPWFAGYAIFRPGRDWQAVHLASGAVLPPARTPQALHHLILADVQARPVTAPGREPVTTPGRDERGDWTRLDVPPARRADRLPRGGGRL